MFVRLLFKETSRKPYSSKFFSSIFYLCVALNFYTDNKMSASQFNLIKDDPLLRNLVEAGSRIRWGDLDLEDEAALQKLGYYGARERAAMNAEERNWYAEHERSLRNMHGSDRRTSSGWTSELEKEEMKLPRKARTLRREHYKRKGELEAKKEAARRERYAAERLRSSEVTKMENARKTRKVKERAHRKAAKKTLRHFLGRKRRV